MKKALPYLLSALIGAAVAIQFAPVRKFNPPVSREIAWDSAETEALARKACYDCHSNETEWPWYASVAPFSWRIAGHVTSGRFHLNFSSWDQPNEDLEEVVEQLEEREMPLWDYKLIHSHARLSDAEYDQLLSGVRATFASDPPIERRRRGQAPAEPDTTAVPPAAGDTMTVAGD